MISWLRSRNMMVEACSGGKLLCSWDLGKKKEGGETGKESYGGRMGLERRYALLGHAPSALLPPTKSHLPIVH